jgi:hypothetical protein
MASIQQAESSWHIQQQEVDTSLIAELHKFTFEHPVEPVYLDFIDSINITSCYQVPSKLAPIQT